MTEAMDGKAYLELSASLREHGIGVKAKTPYIKSESDVGMCERFSDEAALRSNLESLIALYLSDRFRDFDQWMVAQAPMLAKTKDHHGWILAQAEAMRRVAGQCKTLDPAWAATMVYRNLLREVS